MSDMSHGAMLIALKNLVQFHGGQNVLAKKLGVSCQYLNDVLKGKRNIGSSISEPLGYRQIVTITFEYDVTLPALSTKEGPL